MGSYYSNCLLEAIKEKIADWDKIKIHIGYKPNQNHPGIHFWWSYGVWKYQFFADGDVTWKDYLWHKGRVQRIH